MTVLDKIEAARSRRAREILAEQERAQDERDKAEAERQAAADGRR